jgi:hypothetical protein
MEIGVVTYGHLDGFANGVKQLETSFRNARILVLNNKPNTARPSEIQGSYAHYEFSGYLEMCESFKGTGPFVIVNDTLFKTHYTVGWLRLLKRAIAQLNRHTVTVYGDIRWDGEAYAERPNPFLASWLFVLPNELSLQVFKQSLAEILNEPASLGSEAYQAFLHGWIFPKGKFSGWHGGAKDEPARARKERCIRLEHRLSTVLPQHGLPLTSVGSFSPFSYLVLRGIDRLNTRFKALLT